VFFPSVATFANGSYLVSWQMNLPNDTTSIQYAIVNAAGTAIILPPVSIDDALGANDASGRIATSGNTALIVSLQENGGVNIRDNDVQLRLIDAAGNILDNQIVAGAGSVDDFKTPEVAALSDGRFVIVWGNETAPELHGRIYDPAGKTFGPAFAFGPHVGSGLGTSPEVAALPDGGFLVTWHDNTGSLGDASGVHAQRFNANGAPYGAEVLVNSFTDGLQGTPALAANADGSVFVVWQDYNATNTYSGDTDAIRLQGQAFELPRGRPRQRWDRRPGGR
jgi:hypothetical protein